MKTERLFEVMTMGKEADYVPALFAETPQAAEIYRRLLEDHEINVLVGYDELEEVLGEVPENIEGEEGIPLFVPSASLDEAFEVIDDFDNQDEFEETDEDSEEEDEEGEDEFGMGETSEEDEAFEEDDDEDEFGGEAFEDDDDDDEFGFDDDDFEEFEEFDDDDEELEF